MKADMASFFFLLVIGFVVIGEVSSECVDQYSKCQEFVDYCHLEGDWEKYMKTYCQASCPRHCQDSDRKYETHLDGYICIECNSFDCTEDEGPGETSERVGSPGSLSSTSSEIKVSERKEDVQSSGRERESVSERKSTETETSQGSRSQATKDSFTSIEPVKTTTTTDFEKCGVSAIYPDTSVSSIDAKTGSWPWIVSLSYSGRPSHFCGGSLISSKWVVTSSHCVQRIRSKDVQVIAGEHNRYRDEGTEQYRRVKRIVLHPNYNRSNFSNDIALLELENPVELNSQVRLACLPARHYKPPTGLKCFLPGWGTMAYSSSPSPILQQALLPIVRDVFCMGDYRQICAGYESRTLANACRGDKGGPLICQDQNGGWIQQGVAGFMIRYCKHFAAFTMVSDHTDWIMSYISM